MDDPAFAALRRTWQPVALSRDLDGGRVRTCRLLGVGLVVARLDGGVGAFADRCPRRGARFGIGGVVDGHRQCPYTGRRIARGGGSKQVP